VQWLYVLLFKQPPVGACCSCLLQLPCLPYRALCLIVRLCPRGASCATRRCECSGARSTYSSAHTLHEENRACAVPALVSLNDARARGAWLRSGWRGYKARSRVPAVRDAQLSPKCCGWLGHSRRMPDADCAAITQCKLLAAGCGCPDACPVSGRGRIPHAMRR
jgi:hypothetical protein